MKSQHVQVHVLPLVIVNDIFQNCLANFYLKFFNVELPYQ